MRVSSTISNILTLMHRENSRLSHVSHHFRGGHDSKRVRNYAALATATLTRESQCSLYVTNAGSDLALASCIFLCIFIVHYHATLIFHVLDEVNEVLHHLCASRTPKVRLYQLRKYLPHGTAEVWNPVWWLLFMSSRWSLLKTFGNAYPPSVFCASRSYPTRELNYSRHCQVDGIFLDLQFFSLCQLYTSRVDLRWVTIEYTGTTTNLFGLGSYQHWEAIVTSPSFQLSQTKGATRILSASPYLLFWRRFQTVVPALYLAFSNIHSNRLGFWT